MESKLSTISVASDIANTGKVFSSKKRAAAADSQIEQNAKMSLAETFKPIDGVTVFE